MRRWVWAVAFVLVATATSPAWSAPSRPRPNFVIIMADDMGYGDAGCYGKPAQETPNIDALARAGLRFTDFHSSGAVCSPTRAGLLTGRYQQRAGIPGVILAGADQNRHHGLHPKEVTFAELLKEAGYATGIVGKWHLGYEKQFNPLRHGFDRFRGYVSGNIDYHSHLDRTGVMDWWDGLEVRDEPGYSTHLITRQAVGFIEEHRDRPFCLYVAHEAPHDPYQGPNDPPIRVAGKTVREDREAGQAERARKEMMREMDVGVGEVARALSRLGLAERTLVLFLSDNGATARGSNGPLRGHKGSLWEGGHRVPGIACWAGKIKAGGTTDATAICLDVMPTILELAGAAPPASHRLDGVSLAPLLLEGKPLPERTLFWEHGGTRAVRRGPWKLVAGAKRGGNAPAASLFNLREDLAEANDLAASEPERVRSMLEAADAWERDVAAGATKQPERRVSR